MSWSTNGKNEEVEIFRPIAVKRRNDAYWNVDSLKKISVFLKAYKISKYLSL